MGKKRLKWSKPAARERGTNDAIFRSSRHVSHLIGSETDR
jgi:hypothetical protein